MEKVSMVSPWMDYVHKLEAFFKKDDDVTIEFVDGEDRKIKIFVETDKKAEALEKLLPESVTFGNVSVKIIVIPANEGEESKAALFRAAFEGNDAISFIETVSPPFSSNPFTYVVFEKEVVQYWNDNLGDINGLRSTLYQDLAREIFAGEGESTGGVYFCTDIDE